VILKALQTHRIKAAQEIQALKLGPISNLGTLINQPPSFSKTGANYIINLSKSSISAI